VRTTYDANGPYSIGHRGSRYPAWRIFARAGLAPAISLTVLIPFVGPLVAMAILTFVEWPATRGPKGDA
jgi:hypothetical protein